MVDISRRSTQQKPDATGTRKTRWAIIRNSYPDLKNTTAKTWKDWFGHPKFGQFVDVAPFEHRMRYALDDGTKVHCEVIFLALDSEDDVRKLLSLELTGAYVNEAREARKALITTLDGRIGRYPAMRDGGPTWYGITVDSNMPDEDHWLHELHKNPKSGWEFYVQPGGVIKEGDKWVPNPDAENLANLVPDYYGRQVADNTEHWIQVHLAAEWGRLSVEGTYYGEDMLKAERGKRIGDAFYDAALPVHTFWDMGVSDAMAIWVGQASQGQWRWLHYYENTGKSLAHYAAYLEQLRKDQGWEMWGDDVWPHDGNVREMTAQADEMQTDNAVTRAEVWKQLTGRKPIVLGRHKIGDRIEASRRLIGLSRFDRDGTREGCQRLRRYKKRYDKVRSVFLDEPDHDENSHGADAFGTAAMGQGRVSNIHELESAVQTVANIKMDWII